jgi:CRP-like cAMP-binding protein
VPDPLRKEIAQRLRIDRAHKGRTLVEKGSRTNEVFFLLEGRAKVLLYSSDGREVSVHDVGPGDLFGDIAVLDGEPRSASIVASSDLRFAVMRAGDFMAALESSPAAGVWLAKRLASSVRRLTEKVFELSALNVRTRVHCELLRLAQKGEQRNGKIEVRPAPTHAELASRIGTHREAVTRELRELSERALIRYGRGSLTILDLAGLEQAVQR